METRNLDSTVYEEKHFVFLQVHIAECTIPLSIKHTI